MSIVGDRSYAFYLWHWPVLILATQYAGHELSGTTQLGLVAGAFLLSCVSYSLVENPIRRRMRSPAATAVVVGVCVTAVLFTSVVSLAAIDRKQQRFEGSGAAQTDAAQLSTSKRSRPRQGASRRCRGGQGRTSRCADPLWPGPSHRTAEDDPVPVRAGGRLRRLRQPLGGQDKICRMGDTVQPEVDRPAGRLPRACLVACSPRDGLA